MQKFVLIFGASAVFLAPPCLQASTGIFAGDNVYTLQGKRTLVMKSGQLFSTLTPTAPSTASSTASSQLAAPTQNNQSEPKTSFSDQLKDRSTATNKQIDQSVERSFERSEQYNDLAMSKSSQESASKSLIFANGSMIRETQKRIAGIERRLGEINSSTPDAAQEVSILREQIGFLKQRESSLIQKDKALKR